MAESSSSQSSATAAKPRTGNSEANGQLLVVDLGKKQRRKRVKQLRKGRGKLLDKVQELMADLREEGAIGANAQPVVIVVREKDRGLSGMRW